MSLIWADSFDGYTQNEIPNYWLPVNNSPPVYGFMNTFIGFPSRTGPQAIAPAVFGIARGMGIPPLSPFDIVHGGQQSVLIGAAYYFGAGSAGQPVFRFYHGGPQGTVMLTLTRRGDGRLVIAKAGAGTILATTSSDVALRPNQYNYIEWKTGFSNASANEVRINGQVVYSGVLDGSVLVGMTTYTTADVYTLFGGLYDDLYVLALDGNGLTDFVNDSAVFTLIPSSDGAHQQFTPVPVVAHYLNVKENPLDSNSSYNASIGSGSADTYNVTPAIATTDIIKAAQLVQAVADIDSDGQQARPFIVINGAVAVFPADNYSPSGYLPVQTREYELNPLTSLPWVVADLNLTGWGLQQV
jgi:hypothetical protein